MQNREKYLTHLQTEFRKYYLMTDSSEQEKVKFHIQGLMEAGKIFGISFDELQNIVTQEKSNIDTFKEYFATDKVLDIPKVIRNDYCQKKSTL